MNHRHAATGYRITMKSAGTTRAFSVGQRLTTLGVAAFLGFGAMLAVGWYQGTALNDALDQTVVAQNGMQTISSMRLANTELVLAAMDIIVDREKKAVTPERVKLIADTLATINDKTADAVSLANAVGKPELMKTFAVDLAEVTKAIQVDLKTMVETGAPAEAYDAIDDMIDGGGERLSQALATLETDVRALAQTRITEAHAESSRSLILQIMLGFAAMAGLLGLIVFHGSVLRRGIYGIRDSMQKILSGDLVSPVPAIARGDEIGEMARSVDRFRLAATEKLNVEQQATIARRNSDTERESREAARGRENEHVQRAVDALGRGLNRLSEGNLTETIDVAFDGDLESLRHDFNQTVERLQHVIGNVKENTASIQSNSQQMRSAADDLAKRTEQQAASLEETSAALDQITGTVRASTDRAESASRMVDETRTNAEESGRIVGDAVAAMARIENASAEIGKIINVIDEIAFQTNLLALNAGVEAARAGEAGKGFAVVAQEVRELAQRAAGAAKDIKALVSRSSSEVGTGVKLVQATGDALGRIGADVARINEHMKSIVMSAREQQTGLSEINTAIGQLDQMTQQNAAMVEETNAASHTLAQDADMLGQQVSQFRLAGNGGREQSASARVSRPASPAVNTVSRASQSVRNVAPRIITSTPKAATAVSRPTSSPAKALMGRVAGAFGNAPSSPSIAAGSGDNWEEF